MKKIDSCGAQLSSWNKKVFGNVQKNLAEAKSKLEKLQTLNPTIVSKEALERTKKDVHIWLERDELMWKQRSKVMWL